MKTIVRVGADSRLVADARLTLSACLTALDRDPEAEPLRPAAYERK